MAACTGAAVDDVVVNKVAVLERCVARVREVHAGDDAALLSDQLRQDSVVLNLHGLMAFAMVAIKIA